MDQTPTHNDRITVGNFNEAQGSDPNNRLESPAATSLSPVHEVHPASPQSPEEPLPAPPSRRGEGSTTQRDRLQKGKTLPSVISRLEQSRSRSQSPVPRTSVERSDFGSQSPSAATSSGGSENNEDHSAPRQSRSLRGKESIVGSNISFKVQPPTRSPTIDDAIEQMNNDNLMARLFQPRKLSPLRISTTQSPSRSQSSSGSWKRSPSPEITEDDGDDGDEIFPPTIRVVLNLTFFGKKIDEFTDDEVQLSTWTVQDSYKQLVLDSFMNKLQDAHEELRTQDIYLRYGTCQVKGPTGLDYESRVSIVKDHEDLCENAIRGICYFIAKHPYKSFSLNVHWDYGSAQVKAPTERQRRENIYPMSYAELIKKEIEKKIQKNFLRQDYIPRHDLNVFLQPSVIEQVVKEDSTLELDDESRNQFITRIQSCAPKLFAICVYRGSKMAFLKHLMDEPHNCHDILEHRPKMGMECNKGNCEKNEIKQMVNCQPIFFAEKIARDYQHHDLSHEKVLPLHDVGEPDDTDCATRHVVGSGSNGKVFAVKINLAHNDGDAVRGTRDTNTLHESLVPVARYESPDRYFAVKQFTDSKAFNKEKTILNVFVDYPHPHIVLHLTTWTQNETNYILYDLARCNLREYITKVEQPKLTRPHVLWFLRQLDGLAKAIGHVHSFRRPSLFKPQPDVDMRGRHNDIKPENILVFEKAPNQNPVFKITDFGYGVFTKDQGDVSKKSRNVRGTETYWAPDYDKDNGVSRPFDIWALGCVYLELVLWLFGFFQDTRDSGFATRRKEFPGYDEQATEDRFWYSTGRGKHKTYHLKPAVSTLILDLKNQHCKGMRAFSRVLQTIESLLCIDSKTRMCADDLIVSMTSIVSQTMADLKNQPEFYLSRQERNTGRSDASEKLGTERIDPDMTDYSPVSRSPSFENDSRANSMGETEFAHMNPGPSTHLHLDLPGEAGELGRALERLSALPQPPEL